MFERSRAAAPRQPAAIPERSRDLTDDTRKTVELHGQDVGLGKVRRIEPEEDEPCAGSRVAGRYGLAVAESLDGRRRGRVGQQGELFARSADDEPLPRHGGEQGRRRDGRVARQEVAGGGAYAVDLDDGRHGAVPRDDESRRPRFGPERDAPPQIGCGVERTRGEVAKPLRPDRRFEVEIDHGEIEGAGRRIRKGVDERPAERCVIGRSLGELHGGKRIKTT